MGEHLIGNHNTLATVENKISVFDGVSVTPHNSILACTHVASLILTQGKLIWVIRYL